MITKTDTHGYKHRAARLETAVWMLHPIIQLILIVDFMKCTSIREFGRF